MFKAVNQLKKEFQDVTIKHLLKCKNGNDLIRSIENKIAFRAEKVSIIKSQEHRDFFKKFVDSQTFDAFADSLRKLQDPSNKRVFEFVSSYRDKKKETQNLDMIYRNDLNTKITVDAPRPCDFEDLQEAYLTETKQYPIQEKRKTSAEGKRFFQYTIFPKLLKRFTESDEVLRNISWPEQTFSTKPIGLRSLAHPHKAYNHENINSIIWVTCWIATYYYHKDNEKKVHIVELITNLPRMKIGEKQRTLIATYVIEAVIHFGDTEELKFQNFSYLQHHIKSLLPASSNIKICNKFMLASKMLDLGKVYHVPVKETVKGKNLTY